VPPEVAGHTVLTVFSTDHYFTDQFENVSNFAAHFATTGPEIWRQSGGEVDAFIMGSGTGGTIAGVSRFLKQQNPAVKVFLVDPQGSSLYNRVSVFISRGSTCLTSCPPSPVFCFCAGVGEAWRGIRSRTI